MRSCSKHLFQKSLRMFWPWRVLVVMGLLWFARSQTACFLIATPWISQGEVIPSWQGMTEQTIATSVYSDYCMSPPFQNDLTTKNESESEWILFLVLSLSFFSYWRAISPGSPQEASSREVWNWRPSRGAFRAPYSPQDNRLFSWDLLGLDVTNPKTR